MPPSSPALVLQPPDDLPIVIRKGTHSTYNSYHVYNFLSYHCLSLPYFVFVSILSFVSIPTSTSEVLTHLGWKQEMVEEMFFPPMAHGNLSLFLLASLILVIVGFK